MKPLTRTAPVAAAALATTALVTALAAGPAVAEATHAAVRATSTNGSHSFG